MRLKLIVIIFLALSAVTFAQENKSQSPNVELPDFVITGKDIISVPKAAKMPPGFISTVTKEYLNPNFSPDILGVPDFNAPINNKISLYDTTHIYNSYLRFGVSRYNLPEAKVFYGVPFTNGTFDAYFQGINRLAYVNYSDFSKINAGLNFNYYVPNNSQSFAGTHFIVNGNYGANVFKLYGAPDSILSQPDKIKRTLNTGNLDINIKNLSNDSFIYDVKSINNFTALPNQNFTENLYNLSAYGKVQISSFSIGLNFLYKNQFLPGNGNAAEEVKDNGLSNYFSMKPFVGLKISDVLNIRVGFNYSKTNIPNTRGAFYPFGEAALKLAPDLTLLGEFSPHTEFISNGEFLRQNRFYDPFNSINVLTKKSFDLKGALKYEYGRYFEIDGGVSYFSADKLPYFVYTPTTGQFDVSTTGADSYSAFLNLLFHMGPYGMFYGNAELNKTVNDGNIIPYYPQFKTSFVYGYYFDIGLDAEINFTYSSSYADLKNTTSVSFADLGLKFDYEFLKQLHFILELSNLTNNVNYYWQHYQELPRNIVGGFLFRW
jgi:hypothetical protein